MILVSVALAALFEDVTASTIGSTGQWTNQVRLADLDGDGDLDVLFADGGDYNTPGTPVHNQAFLNDGAGGLLPFVLPGGPGLTRSLAVGDLNRDGLPDLLVPGAHQTPSQLWLADGAGGFQPGVVPAGHHSIGDVELGDLDGDGHLDVLCADWGPGDPLSNGGARARLWLNTPDGLQDVSEARLPDRSIGMSWDLSLADVDGDFDLDVLVSSKTSPSSALFLNDGTGTFSDDSARIPARTNNYAFAVMDLDGDLDLDLFTINDGVDLRERLLVNDGTGTFSSGNGTAFPAAANLGEDDNVARWLDADDDGDADVVIGSLSGDDRLLRNDDGVLNLSSETVFPGFTSGTLGLAFGDLNGDGRLDAVMAQGELADDERVYFGDSVAVDSHPPVFVGLQVVGEVVKVRAHDRLTPVRASDLLGRITDDEGRTVPLTFLGGDLFMAVVSPSRSHELCLSDRAGNTTCRPFDGPRPTSAPPVTPPPQPTSCGCGTGISPPWLGLLLLGLARRRRD